MSKSFVVISIFHLLFLNNCGLSKACINSNKIKNIEENTAQQDTVITLERSICMGTCPAYNIYILGDGTVYYYGKQYVKTTGLIKSSISRDDVKMLIDKFYSINYFQYPSNDLLGDECEIYATDNPTVTTSIKLKDRQKEIIYYHGLLVNKNTSDIYKDNQQVRQYCYPDLIDLEDTIDKVVGSKRWILE
jgi:hypothetical protein